MGLQGVKLLKEVTGDYKGSQELTWDYSGLQEVTWGNKRLQGVRGVTGGY